MSAGVSERPRVLVAEPEEWAATAARWIADRVRAAVAERGRCALALAGGQTPRSVYEALALHDLPWDAVDVYFGDERRVPADDPRSNYRMAREALLDTVQPGSVHRMPAERPDAEAAALDYEAVLPDRFDLIVLGVGPDAHTASLFPGSSALAERVRRVVPVPGPQGTPDRLTLTPPVLSAARERVVLARGRDKARVVAQALDALFDPAARPIQLARRGTWILDRDAAALLDPVD